MWCERGLNWFTFCKLSEAKLNFLFCPYRDRVFKSSHKQMKNSVVMTPPPIHINGQGNREVSVRLGAYSSFSC